MASTIKIVQNGVDVYDFNTYPSLLTQFMSNAPEMRSEDLASSLKHGRDVLYARWENVEDVLTVLVAGDTQDDVQDGVRDIERVLAAAPLLARSEDTAYWLHYKPDGATATYRTRILFAYIISSETRAWEPSLKLSYGANADKEYSRVQVAIRRDYYWESTTLTDISLSNGHGSGTGGVTVYWGDDGTYDNWLTIAANAINGSLPTPLYLEMTNNNNDSAGIKDIWVSLNSRFTPTSMLHVWEAESATLYGVSSASADATYSSNGSKVVCATSTSDWYTFIGFVFTTAQLNYMRNRWFRVLGRFYNMTDDMYLRMRHIVPSGIGGATIKTSTPVYLDNVPGIYDLGAVKLPPYDLGSYSAGDVELRMDVKEATASAGVDFSLDYIILMPAEEMDGVAHFKSGGHYLEYQDIFKYDGPKGIIVQEDATEHFGVYYHYGRPLEVWPNTSQRLYFQFYRDSGSDIGARTWNITAKAKYRERRLRV